MKVDWNASAQDKLHVRYSRQAFESAPLATVMRCHSPRPRTIPSGAWRSTGTASSASRWSTTCSSASTTPHRLSDPIDLLGLGKLNNELGIRGDQVVRGLTNIRWGNDLTEIGSAETGTNNVNPCIRSTSG